jgi:hypothetical protein
MNDAQRQLLPRGGWVVHNANKQIWTENVQAAF